MRQDGHFEFFRSGDGQLRDFLESQSLPTAANRFRLPYASLAGLLPISLTDMLLLKSVENVGQ